MTTRPQVMEWNRAAVAVITAHTAGDHDSLRRIAEETGAYEIAVGLSIFASGLLDGVLDYLAAAKGFEVTKEEAARLRAEFLQGYGRWAATG